MTDSYTTLEQEGRMAKKTGIKSPLMNLNGYKLDGERKIFSAELEVSQKAVGRFHRKVLTAYSVPQDIPADGDNAMTKMLGVVDNIVLKKIQKTTQSFLYHGESQVNDLFRGLKVGDTVSIDSSFNASASPLEAVKHTEADGMVLVIKEPLAFPIEDETDENSGDMMYVLPGAEYKVRHVARQTWAHGSKISRNLLIIEVEQV